MHDGPARRKAIGWPTSISTAASATWCRRRAPPMSRSTGRDADAGAADAGMPGPRRRAAASPSAGVNRLPTRSELARGTDGTDAGETTSAPDCSASSPTRARITCSATTTNSKRDGKVRSIPVRLKPYGNVIQSRRASIAVRRKRSRRAVGVAARWSASRPPRSRRRSTRSAASEPRRSSSLRSRRRTGDLTVVIEVPPVAVQAGRWKDGARWRSSPRPAAARWWAPPVRGCCRTGARCCACRLKDPRLPDRRARTPPRRRRVGGGEDEHRPRTVQPDRRAAGVRGRRCSPSRWRSSNSLCARSGSRSTGPCWRRSMRSRSGCWTGTACP